jgi:hypothetical protein
MSKGDEPQLPPELTDRLRSFMREDGDDYVIDNMEGLVAFIVEHHETYPSLLKLVNINEQAVIDHFSRTGEVPPGVRIVRKETEEGSNVTKVNVYTSHNTRKKQP